ncbi:MAG: hypothetical protein JNN25_14635 [Candidatus Kapabacteria bacterium]|nr:hypothetical protein [Candidatus Kapabacteria bacterium]
MAIAILGLFVGFSLYISPDTFVEKTNFSEPTVRFLSNMWAARQIAIALIIGYSVIKKSVPMLTIALAAYCLMNIQDLIIGIISHDFGLATGSGLFSLLTGIMIVVLNKQKVS